MTRASLVVLAALVCVLGACQTQSPSERLLLKNQQSVEDAAGIIAAAALTSIDDDTQRAGVARRMEVVAAAVEKASSSQTDLSGVDAIVREELADWDSRYRPLVLTITTATMNMVARNVDEIATRTTANTREKLLVTRTLLHAAAQGIHKAAAEFPHPTAATGPK